MSKEQTGIWIEFENPGVKKLIDWVISLTPKSRKQFLNEIIEKSVYDILSELPGIEDMLSILQKQEVNPNFNILESYQGIVERVESRKYVSEEVESNV